jgi:hypothetical protein
MAEGPWGIGSWLSSDSKLSATPYSKTDQVVGGANPETVHVRSAKSKNVWASSVGGRNVANNTGRRSLSSAIGDRVVGTGKEGARRLKAKIRTMDIQLSSLC